MSDSNIPQTPAPAFQLNPPNVLCACGCGQQRPLKDRKGRPRRYILGHDKRGQKVVVNGVRPCTHCNEIKPVSCFGTFYSKANKKFYYREICTPCGAIRGRKYREGLSTAPEEVEKRRQKGRRNALRRYFNITPEQYDQILAAQDGRCAICRSDKPGRKNSKHFSIDHSHSSGKVRGILCQQCNQGIGNFRDDPKLLKRAIAYLLSNLSTDASVWLVEGTEIKDLKSGMTQQGLF